jgi:hypothetical protein
MNDVILICVQRYNMSRPQFGAGVALGIRNLTLRQPTMLYTEPKRLAVQNIRQSGNANSVIQVSLASIG